jgi:hypothetical protein
MQIFKLRFYARWHTRDWSVRDRFLCFIRRVPSHKSLIESSPRGLIFGVSLRRLLVFATRGDLELSTCRESNTSAQDRADIARSVAARTEVTRSSIRILTL